MKYTHIVFDFGNVLFDLDIEGCYDRMEKLINIRIDEDLYNKSLRPVFEQYERGEVSDETLIWRFQQFNENLNPRLFVDAWNSMLVSMEPQVFDMLKDLRAAGYNVSLLSNINGFHARYIARYLQREYGVGNFLISFFDYYFYSHELGMRKPEVRIYEYVSNCLAVKDLGNILFIDDNKHNINAAQEFGWSVKHHNPSTHISKVIESYLS